MESGCAKKHAHGVSRSLVRRIGSCLPINTGQRVYIQLPTFQSPLPEHSQFKYAATGQVYHSDGLILASRFEKAEQFDTEYPENNGSGNAVFQNQSFYADDEVFMDTTCNEEEDSLQSEPQNSETLAKISALETELAKLKAQIAVYALSESGEQQVPLPPPPPPPPPPTAVTDKGEIPKEMKPQQSALNSGPSIRSTPAKPQMVDVLKDIGSVRLRSVNAAKSPGGTPLRPKPYDIDAASNDPASIIALALRKKFSHKVFRDSPDKENLDRSDSSLCTEFDSPNVKLFST